MMGDQLVASKGKNVYPSFLMSHDLSFARSDARVKSSYSELVNINFLVSLSIHSV